MTTATTETRPIAEVLAEEWAAIDPEAKEVCAQCGKEFPLVGLVGVPSVTCPFCNFTPGKSLCAAGLKGLEDRRQREAAKLADIEANSDEGRRRKQREREEREQFLQSCTPEYPCPRCGERLWKMESISPSKVSATWRCDYCKRREIVLRGQGEKAVPEESRRSIPKNVQREVWTRDGGKCAECGSKENLEFDHVIPVSKGGGNTARNIQLLCEECNRKKSDRDPGHYGVERDLGIA